MRKIEERRRGKERARERNRAEGIAAFARRETNITPERAYNAGHNDGWNAAFKFLREAGLFAAAGARLGALEMRYFGEGPELTPAEMNELRTLMNAPR